MITTRIGKLNQKLPRLTLFVCLFAALAVYMRSPAALKNFGIIQLPSKSTSQSYTGAFMHKPGARKQCITSQVAHYVLFEEQCRESAK